MNISYYIKGDDINYEKIDTNIGESLNYTSKLIDAENITALFNDVTSSFVVPASSRNNKIFKHWFEIGVGNGFDPNLRKDSYLEFNSIPLRYGVTQLEEITEKNGEIESYKISFYGKLTGLDDRFGSTTLQELDYLDNFDFAYVENNIKALFQNPSLVITEGISDLKPSLVMPLIISADRDVQYYSGTNATPLTSDITVNEGRLNIEDLRPALRQYRIIEAIEDKFGIEFSRDFLDSNDFLNLYTSLNHNEDFDNIKKWQELNLGSYFTNDFLTLTNNELNLNITSQKLKSRIGSKPFDVRVIFGIEIDTINPQGDGYLYFRIVNSRDEVVLETEEGKYGGIEYFNIDQYINTEKNDVVNEYYRIEVYSDGVYLQADGSTYNITYTIHWLGDNYNPTLLESDTTSNSLPIGDLKPIFSIKENIKDITVSDYIKNLIKQFKLVIRPLSETKYTLIKIDDYFKNGDVKDITSKVDIEEINSVVFRNNRKIKYKFNQNEDITVNKKFKSAFGRIRGNDTKIFAVDNKKEDEIEIDFEVPPFTRLNDNTRNIKTNLNIALYTEASGGEINKVFPENFLQFYYVGLTEIEKPIKVNFFSSKAQNTNVEDISIVPICDTSNSYTPSQITNNLDFSVDTINGWHNKSIGKNIYNQNHKPFLDNLLNSDNRLTNLTANLSTKDVFDLDLNTNIIYKNQIYIINQYDTDLDTNQTKFTLFPFFDNKYEITGTMIENQDYNFTSGGGFASINIQTEEEIQSVESNDPWVQVVNAQSNQRVYNISFFVQERYTNTSRTGTITVRIDNVNYTININQQAGSNAYASGATLTLSQDNWTVDETAVEVPIQVSSNTYWYAVWDKTKFDIIPELGYGNDELRAYIPANESIDVRTLSFVVKNIAETISRSVTIAQDGKPYLNLPFDSFIKNGQADTIDIYVEANGNFVYSTNVAWLTPASGSDVGNSTVTINISENPSTTSNRVGIITFQRENLTETFTLTQSASVPFINLNNDTVGFRDGIESIAIQSNTSYNITTTTSWITLNQTSGNGDATITFNYDINMGAERTGTITFNDVNSGLSTIYTVTQELFVMPAPSQPGKPTATNYVVSDVDRVYVDWTASTSEFDSVKDYVIERSENFGVFTQLAIVTATNTAYSDYNVGGGDNYRYRITARDTSNIESIPSAISDVEVVPERLRTTQDTFNVSQFNGSTNFDIKSNTTWTINITSPSGQIATSNLTSGSGNDNIIITYPENQRDFSEEYTITISYANTTKIVRIYQAAFIRTLTVARTPDTNSIGNGTKIFTLDVTSNYNWTAQSPDSWISFDATSGNNNGTVRVYIDANTVTSDRTGSYSIRIPLWGGGYLTRTFSVVQDAAYFINVAPPTFDTDWETASVGMNVYSNTSYTITSPTWVTSNITNGSNNSYATLTINENLGLARTGTVTVSGNGKTDTMFISQTEFVLPAPSTPGTPVVSVSGDTVNLSWTASISEYDSIKDYVIERSENFGSWLYLATSTTNSYADSNTFGGRSYRYRVVARDTTNQESNTSGISTSASVSSNLSITPTTASVDDLASTVSCNVTSNANWVVEITTPVNGATIQGSTTNRLTGSKNGSFIINIPTNTNTTSRTFTVGVYYDSKVEYLTITQDAKSFITITPSTTTTDWETASLNLNITSNTSYTITSPTWVSTSLTNTSGDRTVTVTIAENLGLARTGTVTVSGDGITKTLSISQGEFVLPKPTTPGTPTATVSGDTINLSWTASTSEYDSIKDYVIERSENFGSWLYLATSTTNSYADSNTFGGRSYRYRVVARDTTNQESNTSGISISKEVASTLTLSKTTASVDDLASTVSCNVTSNANWVVEISTPVNGATINGGGNSNRVLGSKDGSFVIDIPTNTNTISRTFTVGVYYDSKVEYLTITQDAKSFITITPTTTNTDWEAVSFGLSITSNTGYNISSPTWVSTSLTNTSGNRTVTVSIAENLGLARTGNVTVSGDGINKTLSISQGEFVLPAPSTPGTPVVSVSGDTVNLSWTASTSEYDSIKDYVIERSENFGSWSFLGFSTTTTYADNDTFGGRSYRYRVTARDTTNQESNTSGISISKEVASTLTLSKTTASVDDLASTVSCNVTSNANWVVEISTPVNGATINGGGNSNRVLGSKDGSFVIDIPTNTNTTSRTFTVGVYYDSKVEYLTITQDAKSFITITPTTTNTDWEAVSFGLSITSNTGYNISSPTWVSTSATTGTGNKLVDITVAENLGTSRLGEVIVSGDGINKTLSISQGEFVLPAPSTPGTPTATLSGSTVNLSWTASTSEYDSIKDYEIQRSVNGGAWSFLGFNTTTTYADNDTLGSQKYRYRIIARDTTNQNSGLSNASTEVLVPATISVTRSPNTNVVGYTTSTYTLTITSNAYWTTNTADTFITFDKANGTGDATVTVTIAENTSTNDRNGSYEIRMVKSDGTTQQITFSVAQDGTPFITITPTTTSTNWETASLTLSITSNTGYNISSPTWVSTSATSGNGDKTVTVTIAENLGIARTGNVTVSGNGVSKSLSISQGEFVLPKPTTPGTPVASIDSIDINKVNVNWTASTSEYDSIKDYVIERSENFGNWFTVATVTTNSYSDTNTDGGRSYRYRVTARDTTNQESNTSGISTSITISSNLSVTPTTYSVDRFANSRSFTVTSNSNWVVEISTPVNNASIQGSTTNRLTGSKDGSFVIDVPANPDSTQRTYTVGVYYDDKVEYVTITQDAYIRTLSVVRTPNTDNVGEDASTFTLDITSNTSWNLVESLSWLSSSITSGSGNGTITMSVSTNYSNSSRSGSYYISGSGVSNVNYLISQEGQPHIIVSPTTKTVSEFSHTYDISVTSNVNWTVSTQATWASVTKINSTTARVNVTANDFGYDRVTTINFNHAEVSQVNSTLNQDKAITLYGHITYYSNSSSSDACLASGTTTGIWTDTQDFGLATKAYSNSNGSTYAPVGYYNRQGTWIYVTTNGDVSFNGICSTGGGGGTIDPGGGEAITSL